MNRVASNHNDTYTSGDFNSNVKMTMNIVQTEVPEPHSG